MINRIQLRQRFKQWVSSSEYILSIADGATLGAKIMHRRRLRNNFNKLKKQVKALQRVEHIEKRVAWFMGVRKGANKNDCYQSWRLWVKKWRLAKKFLMRSSNGLDKQLVNEGFGVWKQMCSIKRQKLYLANIEELNRRKLNHEDQISQFRVKIETNESKQKHLQSKMQQQAHRIMGNFIVRMIGKQTARGFY
jgi:hypothetical protein